MLLLTILLACGTADPSTSPTDTPSVGEATSDTGTTSTSTPSTASTGSTASSGSTAASGATGDTGTPPEREPIDCNAPTLPVPLRFRATGGDAVPFEPRPDGTFWFAQSFAGLAAGLEPATAVQVHSERANAVRTMPNGEVVWLGDPGGPATVYREVGGVPTVWATLPGNPVVSWFDLEPHASGSLIVAGPVGTQWIDATGGHTFVGTTAGPSAYAADHASLWALDVSGGSYGLHTVPIDADGRPDWASGTQVAGLPALPVGTLAPIFYDLEVDACDRVYLFVKTDALTFQSEQLWIYTPTDGTWAHLADVPQGYGPSYPRIGRAPGDEQTLMMRTSYPDGWMRWHLGTGAAVP